MAEFLSQDEIDMLLDITEDEKDIEVFRNPVRIVLQYDDLDNDIKKELISKILEFGEVNIKVNSNMEITKKPYPSREG